MEHQPAVKIPSTWPGAFSIYALSKRTVMTNVWPIVFFGLLGIAVSLSMDVVLTDTLSTAVIKQAVSIVAGAFTTVGTTLLYLAGIKGEHMDVDEALKKSIPYLLRMIGISFMLTLIAIVTLLMFVIPFLLVMPRLVFANFFLVDKDMGVIDSIKASWDLSEGHTDKVWGIIGVTLLIALLLLTIIGIPVAIYLLVMYGAAIAVLYKHLIDHKRHGHEA